MQQSHDDVGAYANMYRLNQVYQESINSSTIEGREALEQGPLTRDGFFASPPKVFFDAGETNGR